MAGLHAVWPVPIIAAFRNGINRMKSTNGNGNSQSWERAYRELLQAVTRKGYPEEFGKAIAKNLGSEKMMSRMTAYLYSANPRSAEEIADEMLAIMSDRERWIQKKETEYYNSRYNEMLNDGLED